MMYVPYRVCDLQMKKSAIVTVCMQEKRQALSSSRRRVDETEPMTCAIHPLLAFPAFLPRSRSSGYLLLFLHCKEKKREEQ